MIASLNVLEMFGTEMKIDMTAPDLKDHRHIYFIPTYIWYRYNHRHGYSRRKIYLYRNEQRHFSDVKCLILK